MQPAKLISNRAFCAPCVTRRKVRAFTLIELLVASLLVAVAIMGLVSTWYTMLNATLNNDERGASYEIARTVLERARVSGFSINIPNTMSQPDGVPTTWSSPNIMIYRYFDDHGTELGSSNTAPPAPVAGTRFLATTNITGATTANYPSGSRPDLQLRTIQVTVNLVGPDGSVGEQLADLETCMTEGGIQ